MKTYPLVLAALLLAGCVNVHVHFPSAPAPAGDPQQSDPQQSEPQKKP